MKNLIIMLMIVFTVSAANATTIARTTANSLNVRSTPAGEVVFAIPRGTLVGVMQIQGNWVKIMYLPGNNPQSAKLGWVSVQHLEIINSQRQGIRSYSGVSGDDCAWEYDSNAQVCVSVTNVSLDCRKSYDRMSYRSCEVEVEYDVSTDYEGDDYLDVEVECSVDITYKKRDSYSWSSDSDSDDENHSLYSYGSDSDDMIFDFSFSSYYEVINVKIESVDCEIDSVYKY